jgi:hypothetical protein
MSFLDCFDVESGQWCTVATTADMSFPVINVVPTLPLQSDPSQTQADPCPPSIASDRDILIRVVLRPGQQTLPKAIPIWVQAHPDTQFVEATCEPIAASTVNRPESSLTPQCHCTCAFPKPPTQTIENDKDEPLEIDSSQSTISCAESVIEASDELERHCLSVISDSQTVSDYSPMFSQSDRTTQSTSTPLNRTRIVDLDEENESPESKASELARAVRRRPKRANAFIGKLFEVLETGYWKCIQWDDEGKQIMINLNALDVEIVKRPICRTKQPASFIRQLHLYGFRRDFNKPQTEHFDQHYMNQYFQRNRPDLLIKLKPRKSPATKSSRKRSTQESSSTSVYDENDGNLQNTLNTSVSPSKFCKLEQDLFFCD